MREAFEAAGITNKQIAPGEIWTVDDTEIAIPRTDPKKRTYHAGGRTCLVLSNDYICAARHILTISVAPLTHYADQHNEAEHVIEPSGDNGLDARSCVMLGHIQPILKIKIFKRVGRLSINDWEIVLAKVVSNFDRA